MIGKNGNIYVNEKSILKYKVYLYFVINFLVMIYIIFVIDDR